MNWQTEKQHTLLELLLASTRSKALIWEATACEGDYEARHGDDIYQITFKYPLLVDYGSDPHLAVVRLPGLEIDFYAGTDGMNLVIEILSVNFPERAAGLHRFRDRIERRIQSLREMVDGSNQKDN